jgi:peptide-N4-(N-acetyl-beta-glucosaminyl)asparagine amidase
MIARKGWSNCAYRYENVQYKVEHDWKMCYLARKPNTDNSSIEWFFKIHNYESFKKIEIKSDSCCYESGIVGVYFVPINGDNNELDKIALDNQQTINSKNNLRLIFDSNVDNKTFTIRPSQATNLKGFKIRIEMKHGKGDNSWQHTQLFRQSLNDNKDQYLFNVSIYLN